MIIGGQAVLVHGEPRLTKDIDVTLGVGVEEVERIQETVKKINLKLLVKDVHGFVKKTMVLPTADEKSGIRVDFIFSFSPYERQAIERAISVNIGRVAVQFAAVEDVVIHKVVAKRARDLEDVRSILLKNPDYDKKYVKKWLREFDAALNENFIEIFTNLINQIRR